MKKYILILSLAICFACNNTSQNRNSNNTNKNLTPDNLKISEQKNIISLSEEEKKILENESKIGRMIIFSIKSNILDIVSDGMLTYKIFGNDNNVSLLLNKYKIFHLDKEIISTDFRDEPAIIYKLFYKKSFLKIYYNGYKETDMQDTVFSYDIVSGHICNKEIIMTDNIYIGMQKEVFFNKIFNNSSKYNFSEIDTLINSNEMGEINQYYVFEADTLKEIILKSDYDWIPFDL
jgi:hypothetical protein